MSTVADIKKITTLKDLKEAAKKWGVPGYSKAKKDEMEELRAKVAEACQKEKKEEKKGNEAIPLFGPTRSQVENEASITGLKKMAKAVGVTGFSAFKKETIEELRAKILEKMGDEVKEPVHARPIHVPVHLVRATLQDPTFPTRAELDQGLQELRSRHVPLKWGDLVSFSVDKDRNDGVVIYDGEKLIDLAVLPDEYGTVPSQFRVLVPHPESKEIIPLGYWHLQRDDKGNITEGICHNTYVWLDHARVGEELIRNLSVSANLLPSAEKKYVLFSHFTVEGVQYEVVVVTFGEEGFSENGSPLTKEAEEKLVAKTVKFWRDPTPVDLCSTEAEPTENHPHQTADLYSYTLTPCEDWDYVEKPHRLFLVSGEYACGHYV